MKHRKLLLIIIVLSLFFIDKNVYAFDVNNYKYRSLCAKYEVAGFHNDGYIDTVSCHGSYNEAKTAMKNNGAADLAIMTKVNGETKIIDANQALLDLSVNPTTLTYFYENSELTGRQYTYMDTGSLYGGTDGGLLDSGFSSTKGVFTAKVRTGNFTGWISQEAYEIVPITWLKSYSSYTVTNDNIRHNYVAKIQNDYKSAGGSTIGPKPEMLSPGTYYSFDGHYFYNNISSLMLDYKSNSYGRAVNSNNPYYNYYMYLSNHTKTSYSSINIDEYIRNNLGYTKNVYGHVASSGTSRLYGSGKFFYYAQEKYGVNAILSLSLSRNETGNGRSNLSINKNNGFGLNAVDSNPTQAANWYATFQSSILGYANKWITYGYAHPRDWRYFGPQFGDKWIGMNVKYASDTYWSEKMASNYYNMDKALGLQDYNYYQLGVLVRSANAYQNPSTSSKFIYQYPEAEDAVVIVGEVTSNGEKWYKVVSDLNIDSNYNEITSGAYNWNSYVYVKASDIKKINKGKNGYISPNSVTKYIDSNYEYDLYDQGNTFTPKAGISTNNTSYYYDSSLQSKTGSTLLKDRYVVIYAKATQNGKDVSYLVTSDYFYDQKHWVKASDISITDTSIGKVRVDTNDNQYTWVNYNMEDKAYSKISGLYTYTYVPVLSSEVVGNDTWYKVPVSLTTNNNVYGYTLAKYSSYISVDLNKPITSNNPPTISATNKEIYEGESFDNKKDVTAYDPEEGDLTKSITITSNNVNTTKPGTYQVTYQVKDSKGLTATKTITVTVKENKAPEISAEDKTITVNTTFKELENVTATDPEDGDITKSIKVKENTVNTKTIGTYKVVYEVTDSRNKTTTKEIKVEVVKDREPVINADDTNISIDSEFNPLEGVTAIDPEDGDITKNLKVTTNTVNTNKLGTYEVTYEVVDSSNNKVTKTRKVTVSNIENMLVDALYYFDYLKEVNGKLEIKGYNAIKGMNNTLNENIRYELLFESTTDSSKTYSLPVNRITDKSEMTRPVRSDDGYDYTYSWFKGNITTDNIPDGNYRVYVLSISNNKASKSLISNKLLKPQASSYKDSKYITTLNNYYDNTIPLELNIRTKKIGDKTASSMYNQYNQYRQLEFIDSKLHIMGNSYSYGMDLSLTTNVERKIIFENQETYDNYEYDLGSITNGLYSVGKTLGDNLDKTKAWFDSTIDISNLPKGTYTIYISNKSNISDYSELSEKLLRDLSDVKETINNKEYSFTINKKQRYRIEMNIK